MSLRDVGVVAAIITGIYGAALSTWNAWAARREKRRTIALRCDTGFKVAGGVHFTSGPRAVAMQAGAEPLYILRIFNPGHLPIIINPPSLQLPDRTVLHPAALNQADFPYEVRPGDSYTLCVSQGQTAAALAEQGYRGTVAVRWTCQDRLGRVHNSPRWLVAVPGDAP